MRFGRGAPPRLPVVFTLQQLSRAMGVSVYRTANILEKSGVPIMREGRKVERAPRFVLRSSIEKRIPDLVDSMRFNNEWED